MSINERPLKEAIKIFSNTNVSKDHECYNNLLKMVPYPSEIS